MESPGTQAIEEEGARVGDDSEPGEAEESVLHALCASTRCAWMAPRKGVDAEGEESGPWMSGEGAL
jgi:hypothetical protein